MMESYPRKTKDEGCSPQLLDLISKEREWLLKMKEDRCRVTSEEKKLELCLGPPGGDNWTSNDFVSKFNSKGNDQQTLLSFAPTTNTTSGTKRGFTDTVNGGGGGGSSSPCQSHSHHVFSHPWSNSGYQGKSQQPQQPQQTKVSSSSSSFLQLQSTSRCLPPPPPPIVTVMSKESSQHCCSKEVDLQQQSTENKAFSLPSAAAAAANTAVPNSSAQKRTAPAAVVGWPPIRSFRKNLASSSSLSKSSPESSSNNKVVVATNEKPADQSCNQKKGMFVKINMDGVPIGRKVDLKSIESYEKLSSAVDELFRGLLVAQGDASNGGGIQKNKGEEGERVITGLLDGSGEYTLVYEDNEGDRMLVGDVPWHMFVSTVKRLRVLKSSEISTLCRVGSKQGRKISLGDGLVK